MPQVEIPIGDDFKNEEGRWPNYDAIDLNQREQLTKQKHVDLRSFVQTDTTVRINMLYLDLRDMAGLNSRNMNALNGSVAVRKGEQWSAGSVGPQADRNNVNGLSLTCTVAGNPNTTESRIPAA